MPRTRVSVDLGPEVSVSELAGVTNDFASISNLALRWSAAGSAAAARSEIEGLSGSSNELGRYGSRLTERETALLNEYTRARSIWEEFVDYPPPLAVEEMWRLARRGKGSRYLAFGLMNPFAGPPRLEQIDPALFEKLLAFRAGELSDGPPVVESLSYENPWEIIVAAGTGMLGGGALTGLLVLLRDWKSGRRASEAAASTAEAQARHADRQARAAADQAVADARRSAAQASIEETKASLIRTAVESLGSADIDQRHSLADLLNLVDGDPEALAAIGRFAALEPAVEELPELEPGRG
jgi:hypothetical protein